MNPVINVKKVEVYVGNLAEPAKFINPLIASIAGTPEVGQPWPEQGGVIAGIMPAQENHPAYYLIVPTDPEAEAEELAWGETGTEIEGLSSWDGKANTDRFSKMEEKFPAGDFCSRLTIGDFNDFYLPARREASLLAATVPHLFKSGWHWTSSQSTAYDAFFQDFSDGTQCTIDKGSTLRVRAVRRFIIN